MRRLKGPGLGLLLLVAPTWTVGAQRPPERPAVVIEEPRPLPVLPAAFVPFTIGPELCRNGHVPTVGLTVYNVLAQPVAILRLRGRIATTISSTQLRCGTHVALWDGTLDGGTRAASPGIYYLQLTVDDRINTRKVIVPQP
ncbi:MAG: hypothetical protein ABIR59_03540 [Gemmatimonadales bacterium]